MARSSKGKTPTGRVAESATHLYARGARRGKVRKEFWLDPELLRAAQAELGAPTERETVERALDLVAFRRELLEGVRQLPRLKSSRLD